jgi:tRNA threonylcarbamoyladenosine biosynthesis protein TsaB
MLVLGIETSTPQSSVAIGSEQGIVGACTVSRGATHGEFLLPAIEFVMRQAGLTYRNLSAVAVGLGPGLFAGMRVGVATAKTLAQALSVPIVGAGSLDLLAYDVRHSSKLICAAIDAKRGEVFYAFYQPVPGGVTRLGDYAAGSPQSLAAEIDARGGEVLLVGNGALLYASVLGESPKAELGSLASAFPRSASLVELAMPRLFREDFDRLLEIRPMYMRTTDAEINWNKRA